MTLNIYLSKKIAPIVYKSLTLYLLHVVSSVDKLCKYFGPRSGYTERRA